MDINYITCTIKEIYDLISKQILLCVIVAIVTLFCYWFLLGENNRKKRNSLNEKLAHALKQVHDLEYQLLSLDGEKKQGKEIRIWMDGAFDMMHYGHMNAFRQGKALGTYLIVGVNSDETITACKGSPVTCDTERIETVRGCKWVDEVVPGVPYIMNDEYLMNIIEKYRIDYIVHGDDPCIVDGKDVYESAQKIGKYLTIPRTEGISTTDIVGRMLLMTRSHHALASLTDEESSDMENRLNRSSSECKLARNTTRRPFDRKTKFLTTSHVLRLFSAGVKPPTVGQKIVYLAGSWDMLHAAHINVLEKARTFGDYIIVGVHNDYAVNSKRGMNLPILNMHERVLSLLGCKFVDDVLIDAPYVVTNELIESLHISVVLKGHAENDNIYEKDHFRHLHVEPSPEKHTSDNFEDPYAVPRELGILKSVESKSTITVLDIVERVIAQRDRFSKKYQNKTAQEEEYYNNKYSRTKKSIS